MSAELRVVLVQRVDRGWRVGIGPVTGLPSDYQGEVYRSIRGAKRAARTLAEKSGLLIVNSDLPRAVSGSSEDID
jgi:hypothetical protein